MKKSKAQTMRENARKIYDASLVYNADFHKNADEISYSVYCDALDKANKIEGKRKVKR